MLKLNKYSTENANYSEIPTMSKNLKYKENESNDMLKGQCIARLDLYKECKVSLNNGKSVNVICHIHRIKRKYYNQLLDGEKALDKM